MFCGKCGSQVADGAAFCGNCGAAVTASTNATTAGGSSGSTNFTQQSPSAASGTNTATSVDEETLQVAYITGKVGGMNRYSKACQHYLGAFRKFTSAGSKVNWHWAAFFLSVYTVAYRKNFLIAFVGYIVYVIFTLVGGQAFQFFVFLLYAYCFLQFPEVEKLQFLLQDLDI